MAVPTEPSTSPAGGPLGQSLRAAPGWLSQWLREGAGSLPRVFWLFFTVFAVGMVLISLVGDQGMISYWRLSDEAVELRAKVGEMEARHRELTLEIRALRDDPVYIEQIARQRLGLVHPGETVLQLPDVTAGGRREAAP